MNKSKTGEIVLCAMFAALTAVGAFIKIPIPLVPFTMQVIVISLAGYILGGKNGMISVLIYISLGLAGLPVFSGGGGLTYIFSPTFGYIIGFAVGAFITGKISHHIQNPSHLRLLAAGFAGLAAVYAIGAAYYCIISHFYLGLEISARTIIISCFLITLPGDIAMTFLAAAFVRRIRSAQR